MRWLLLFSLLVGRLGAAQLTLAFEPRWADGPAAVPTGEFVNRFGQHVQISRWSALVSSVSLERADRSRVQLPGQYGFIDAGAGQLTVNLEAVPAGEYVGIAFEFGVPPAINHADPQRWPAGHPLNPITNRLHWNWQGGYVFAALEGHWRGDEGAADEPRGFSYHVARDENAIPIRFAANFSVLGDTTVKLAVDFAKILGAQRLAPDDGTESTHSAPNDEKTAPLTARWRHAVFWLEADATRRPVEPLATASPKHPAGPVGVGRRLSFKVPAGFPLPDLPEDNPLTEEGMALGQALFTDTRLSGNGTQSCASCHAADRAFSDRVPLSRGADGKRGVRNAMPLFNLAWSPSYAWDGSKPRVRDQAIAAMTNPIEMHGDSAAVVAKLAADPVMVARFRAAFGTPEITIGRVGLALEQCLLANVSADSKFDRAMRGDGALSAQEQEGFALFVTEYDPVHGRRGADCFHCHGGPLFTDYDFKNNGLDRVGSDAARRGVTGRADDAGKFKTPSLRNVAVTGPYMHDGRFATLEDVVAHYDHGVVRSPTLDPNLAKHPADGLRLTTDEQRALVAFLRTLTDARWDKAAK